MNSTLRSLQSGWLKICISMTTCFFSIIGTALADTSATTAAPLATAGWRLNSAGNYQLLSAAERATRFALRPSFCQSPRQDGRAVLWTDTATTSQRLQFSNESGVLRWWSASSAPQMIWSEGAKEVTGSEQLSESMSDQLALIVHPQSPKSLQVVWSEPQLQRYSAVDLTNPAQPLALWQWQLPVAGSVQTPVVSLFKTTTGTASAVIMVSGANAVQPAFWLVDAGSGHQIAAQQYQHTKKTVELPFVLQDLIAAPAVLDRNADGYTDRLYLVDSQGRLVQVDVNEQLQFQSRVVADLSDSAAEFKVQLVATRTRLPDYQLIAANEEPADIAMGIAVKSNIQTEAAGSKGQPADVVLLVSTKKQQSQLWVLTVPDSPAFTIQPHHLTLRDLQEEDADFSTVTSSTSAITTGWYSTLPAAPVSLPQVFAGVLYLPVAASTDICMGSRQAKQLIVRHLFQGSPVYSKEQLNSIPTPFGLPGVVQRSSGELALQDLHNGVLLLPQIRGIRPDCRFCTEALHQSHYPKWQRMAIYQHESEIYR